MAVTIYLRGLPEIQEKIQLLMGSVRNMEPHLAWAVPQFEGAIKRNFAAGGRPAGWVAKADGSPARLVKSDTLRTGIKGEASGDTIRIGTGGQPYAAILHFGGRTKPHIIRPKKAGGALFFSRRGWSTIDLMAGAKGIGVFAKSVNHPGSVFPPRPYMVIIPEEKERGMKKILESMRRELKI